MRSSWVCLVYNSSVTCSHEPVTYLFPSWCTGCQIHRLMCGLHNYIWYARHNCERCAENPGRLAALSDLYCKNGDHLVNSTISGLGHQASTKLSSCHSRAYHAQSKGLIDNQQTTDH